MFYKVRVEHGKEESGTKENHLDVKIYIAKTSVVLVQINVIVTKVYHTRLKKISKT